MSFLWSYVKRNKWKSTLGITASTGALLYTFREPIMEIVKPVTERLLAYAMEQQMNAMKIQGRVEARNTHFKQIGSQTFTNIGDFFPTIIKRIKTKLSVKEIVAAMKLTKSQDISTPELKAQVVRIQNDLYREIVVSRLAEYAACIYASGLLITTFRLYLIILSRHTLDRQPPISSSSSSSSSSKTATEEKGATKSTSTTSTTSPSTGVNPLDLIESAKRFGLNDLRSTATREAVHTHAWEVVLQSLDIIIMSCKRAAEDCLLDIGWKHLTYVNSEEITNLMDNILGHTHELLFNPRLEHEGYALSLVTTELSDQHPEEACSKVITEANCMLNSPIFLDIVASTTAAVALQYSEKLQENITLSIPRDGPCVVNQEMLAAFLNQVAGVAELVPSLTDLESNSLKEDAKNTDNTDNTNDSNDSNDSNETNNIDDDHDTPLPQCQRTTLCDRLMHNEGEMIQKIAGFGPKMCERKASKTFIRNCIQVIRDGPEDVPVDVEEVTEVLEAVLEDVSNRTTLLTAVGKSGLGKVQTNMCKSNAKRNDSDNHPLDKVMGEECLDNFLGSVFEDVVDVVHDRQNNGVGEDDEEGSEAMMMQQLQAMMGGGADGMPGTMGAMGDGGGMEGMEDMMKMMGAPPSGAGGAGAGSDMGMGAAPNMDEMSSIFAAMGQPPPSAEDMKEMDKMMQQMMPGLMNGGNPMGGGGGGGSGFPGMGSPEEMEKMMQGLMGGGANGGGGMDEIMAAMQSPEVQQMAQQFAEQMEKSAQGGVVDTVD